MVTSGSNNAEIAETNQQHFSEKVLVIKKVKIIDIFLFGKKYNMSQVVEIIIV